MKYSLPGGECREPIKSLFFELRCFLGDLLCNLSGCFFDFIVAVIAIEWWPAHDVSFNIFSKVVLFSTATPFCSPEEHIAWDGLGSSELMVSLDNLITLLFFLAEYIFTWDSLTIAHLSQSLLCLKFKITIINIIERWRHRCGLLLLNLWCYLKKIIDFLQLSGISLF